MYLTKYILKILVFYDKIDIEKGKTSNGYAKREIILK